MDFRYGLLCEAYTIDNQTGQISFIKVIESLNIPSPGAALLGAMTLVVIWERSKNEDIGVEVIRESRVMIQQPEGSDIESSEPFGMELNMPSGRNILRGITTIQGLVVNHEGTLNFVIEIKDGNTWREVGKVPVYVTQNASPETSVGLEGVS